MSSFHLIYESMLATLTSVCLGRMLEAPHPLGTFGLHTMNLDLSESEVAGQIAEFAKRGNLGEGNEGDMGKLQEAKLLASVKSFGCRHVVIDF